jgi:hypothetical protein
MVAGTSNWNVVELVVDPLWLLQERSCFLASLIAARVAQCTEAARSNGGSPEAARKQFSVFY